MDLPKMFLISCLGNVGDKYKNNVHNIGFRFADMLQSKFNFSWRENFNSKYGQFIFNNAKIFVQKPSTFMNKSGEAVLAITSFYKVCTDNIFIVHDDIDLEDGQIRIKFSGSNGGHNGLKSIDSLIGRDYWRIRVGVGRPTNKEDVSSFVLSDIKQESANNIIDKYKIILDNLNLLCDQKINNNSIGMLLAKIKNNNIPI